MWTCSKCGKKVDDAYEICWACGTSVDGVEDPHFLDEASLEDRAGSSTPRGSFVTVAECSKAAQAHAMRVQLADEGIPVVLFDEFSNTTMFGLQASSIVQVQVPEPNVERARAILGIVEEEQADTEMHDSENAQAPGDEAHRKFEEGIVDMELHEGIIDKNPDGQQE